MGMNSMIIPTKICTGKNFSWGLVYSLPSSGFGLFLDGSDGFIMAVDARVALQSQGDLP